jgi:sortase A
VDDILPEPGMDYCTLVTCTPYGVNSHRLLVRGHRVEYTVPAENPDVVVEEESNIGWIVAGGAVALVLLAIPTTIYCIKKKRNKKIKKITESKEV